MQTDPEPHFARRKSLLYNWLWSQALRKAMRRRDFVKGIVGSTAVWPLAARAQQLTRMRRVGVLISLAESDTEALRWVKSLLQGLEDLGWRPDVNLQIDLRHGNSDNAQIIAAACPLLAQSGHPDALNQCPPLGVKRTLVGLAPMCV